MRAWHGMILAYLVPHAVGCYPPLHSAVLQGDVEQAKLLVWFCDVNAPDQLAGDRPLHCAVASGNPQLVTLLIWHGANVNGRTGFGYAPLHMAASRGDKAIAELLLSRGADPNARSKTGETPLYGAAAHGYLDVARLLVSRGADVNVVDDDFHATPLEQAVICGGGAQMVKFLLYRGADPNHNAARSLREAAAQGQREIMDLLMDAGADINAATDSGWTPLHSAVQSGDPLAVEFLIRKGARINAKDRSGRTPLALAYSEAQIEEKLASLPPPDPSFDARFARRKRPCVGKVIELLKQYGGTGEPETTPCR